MAACGDSASASSVIVAAEDPGPSTEGEFTFLYSSPNVEQTVEIQSEVEHESSRVGRKQTRNPDNWTKKTREESRAEKECPLP